MQSITDEEVDEQIKTLGADKEFQGPLRLELLKFLIDRQRNGGFRITPKRTGEKVLIEFYEHIKRKPLEPVDDGKHLVAALNRVLKQYYASRGRNDEIVIEIQTGKGFAYEPAVRRRSELPLEGDRSTSRAISAMEALRRRPIHSYHLTRDREGGAPMWAYKVLNFNPSSGNPDELIADAANVPKSGEDKQKFMYRYAAALDHGHLVIRSYRVDASDDITVQLYPHDGLGEHNYPWCGVGMLSRTWHNNPASTICILSDAPLPCAPGAVDGEPISDQGTVRRLEDEWETRAGTLRLMRLPLARPGVQGVTIYPNWDHFPVLLGQIERGPETELEDLRIATIAFTAGGVPEDKLRDLAARNGIRIRILLTDPTTGQAIVDARVKLRTKHGDGETPDSALKALSDQIDRLRERRENIRELKARGACKGEMDFRLSDVLPYGFVAHCREFIVLGLFIATGSYGSGPMIVLDPKENHGLWQTLKTEWHERWTDAKVVGEEQPPVEHFRGSASLAQQIITATRLLREFEARVPDDADIWIASHDLSTVGDESQFATLVREIVGRNARRGVNYTYVCPKGHAGDSRLNNLRDCFLGVPGKLKIHQIPREKFWELTLTRSHFISFNPLDPSATVYLQLPVPTAEKGWVPIDRQSAQRVIQRMKDLHAQYPADDAS